MRKAPREIIAEIQQARETQYAELVATLRAGGQLPPQIIFETLHRARRSAGELVLHVFADRPAELQPGSDCPECGAQTAVGIRSSRRLKSGWVGQYLACNECGARLGKRMVAGAGVRRRKRRPL